MRTLGSGVDRAGLVGECLRRVRHERGLSLQAVERRSRGALPARVVAAYERGEQPISVHRLRALAAVYGVPLGELLPPESERPATGGFAAGDLRLDLVRLAASGLPNAGDMLGFVRAIEVQRGCGPQRTVSLRGRDIEALAALSGLRPGELHRRLVATGSLLDD